MPLKLHHPRRDDEDVLLLYLFIIAVLAFFLAVALLGGKARAADMAEGDSIAKGTGAALHVPTYARTSMGSCWIFHNTPGGHFDHVVLSAGINDPPGPCLEALRARLTAKSVVWILPAPINAARAHVYAVAARYGDRTVSYSCGRGGCTKRNFHPASYGQVAISVRNAWGLK